MYTTQATHTISPTVVIRSLIIAGLGALIVPVVLMIQPPASASTATGPCATSVSASAPYPKCSPCVKCVKCSAGRQRTA